VCPTARKKENIEPDFDQETIPNQEKRGKEIG
jgi:hypothetical protein